MIEAPVIAAIISTAGNIGKDILSKLIERGGIYGKKSPENEKIAAEFVHSHYDNLRPYVTDGCMKVIKSLESGENQFPHHIFARTNPSLKILDCDLERHLVSEFRYRLEYLRLIGILVLVRGSEYAITRLGLHYIREARDRRECFDVLFR